MREFLLNISTWYTQSDVSSVDTKVVYRRYASLFFVSGISSGDNELITLEIIHRYVEVLDRYFGNVSFCNLGFANIVTHSQLLGMRARSVSPMDLEAGELKLILPSIFNFQKAYAVCHFIHFSSIELTLTVDPR